VSTTDVLGNDAPPARWRGGRRARALGGRVLVPLVVLALVGVGADDARRSSELGGLLDRVQQGNAAADYADRRLSATIEYAGPLLRAADAAPAVRADLRRMVQREAAGQVPALQRARDRTAALRVLPWHRSERRAQAASVRLLDERLKRLEEASRSIARLYQRLPEPDASERVARRALERVAPAGRVDAVLRPRL
jgi:hypothetical protein